MRYFETYGKNKCILSASFYIIYISTVVTLWMVTNPLQTIYISWCAKNL